MRMGKNLLKIIAVIYSFVILFMYSNIANADSIENASSSHSNIMSSYYADDPGINNSKPVMSNKQDVNKTTTSTTTTKKVTKNHSSKKKIRPKKKKRRGTSRTRKAMVSPFDKKTSSKKVNNTNRTRKKTRKP